MISSDARLLAAVAAGDVDALEPLIARHHAAVHRFVARRIGADAQDIVSETFETACRYRPIGDDARPWLLGIATNLLRGHARREADVPRLRAHGRGSGCLVS